ncbi:MAG TPA: PilZ domain-containing protein, partial [Candidatus Hydrogenedentes bacterium]|nr:PilZ domain-containing protein [Candidatus Hydrogenedentota bacterium]
DDRGRGLDCRHAQVAQGPRNPGDGVLLTQPRERVRTYHRGSCRVPTDLTVQVKNRAHVRHFDAELLNLSAGGALLRTVAPFDFSTTVEMIVSLPGEPPLTMAGHVVHICDVPERQQLGQRIIGIRFTTPDTAATRFITQFIWQRLHEMYTEY